MPQLDEISKQLNTLAIIMSELRKKRLQISHARARRHRESFKDTLLLLKADLIQLRQKVRALGQSYAKESVEIIEDLRVEIDDLHTNLEGISLDVLLEHVDLVKRLVASLKGFLPMTLLELELNEDEIVKKLPLDIRGEVKDDFTEVKRCFSAQAYRASIAFCGRILETTLGRKYYEKKKASNHGLTAKDVENELATLSFGKIIGKCREVGLLVDQPDVESYADLINRVRILSIHHKGSRYAPGPDAAKGAINFMSEVIRKLYP